MGTHMRWENTFVTVLGDEWKSVFRQLVYGTLIEPAPFGRQVCVLVVRSSAV